MSTTRPTHLNAARSFPLRHTSFEVNIALILRLCPPSLRHVDGMHCRFPLQQLAHAGIELNLQRRQTLPSGHQGRLTLLQLSCACTKPRPILVQRAVAVIGTGSGGAGARSGSTWCAASSRWRRQQSGCGRRQRQLARCRSCFRYCLACHRHGQLAAQSSSSHSRCCQTDDYLTRGGLRRRSLGLRSRR